MSKSQLLKGVLEGCILAIIKNDEVYGYELSVRLANYGLSMVSEGTIYPLLLRLEKEKLIQGTLRKSPSGPNRKYYSLTPAGFQALEEFKQNWENVKHPVEQILKSKTISFEQN